MLLERATQGGMEHIISWGRSGCGFKIHSRKAFETEIMPRYFTSTADPKFRSFQRQLNIYSFRLVIEPSSPDFKGYHHPLFQRGKPELCAQLCAQMKRERIKKKSRKANKKRTVGNNEDIRVATEAVLSSRTPPRLLGSSTSFAKQAKGGLSSYDLFLLHQDAKNGLLEFSKHANELDSIIASTDPSSSTTTTPYKNSIHSKKNDQEEASSSVVVSSTPSVSITRKEVDRIHYRSDSLIPVFPILSQEGLKTLVANIEHEVPPMSRDRQLFFGDQKQEDHNDDEDSYFIW
jgi:hypothetical protein